MAIFDGKSLKGSIGNLAFSKIGKLTVVKSKPGKGGVKQTEATKKTASIFGMHISPFAKQIRLAFNTIHLGWYDGSMVSRMSSAISTIIYQHIEGENDFDFNHGSFKRLEGFDFNTYSPLNESLLVAPTVTYNNNLVSIETPSFTVSKNIRFPKNSSFCQLQVQVTVIDFKKRNTFNHPIELIDIDKFDKTFDGKNFVLDIQGGDLVIIGIALIFSESKHNEHRVVNGKLFHPAGIVAAKWFGAELGG
ncbi:hypothetical protein [Pedobacter aquatilis]|uniref:hypothetical protein n=1 Tax=Pedobacter aquatilis TaxID=351343 RepID=UPI0029308474|nr:hypothetical protein [Pedobacter aquatilis]